MPWIGLKEDRETVALRFENLNLDWDSEGEDDASKS